MVTKPQRGVTLVELIFALLVLGMVLAIGVPGLQNTVRNARMTTTTNDLIAAFQLARSEAIKRRTPVILCTSYSSGDDDAGCNPDATWTDGWLAIADNDDSDDEIVLRHGAITEKGTVRVIMATEGQLADRIVYEPSGFPRPYADGTTGGFLLLCDDRNDNNVARLINVSRTGRPAVSSIDRLPDDLNLFCQASE